MENCIWRIQERMEAISSTCGTALYFKIYSILFKAIECFLFCFSFFVCLYFLRYFWQQMQFWCVFKALKQKNTSTGSRKIIELASLRENLVASLKTAFKLKLKKKIQAEVLGGDPFWLLTTLAYHQTHRTEIVTKLYSLTLEVLTSFSIYLTNSFDFRSTGLLILHGIIGIWLGYTTRLFEAIFCARK